MRANTFKKRQLFAHMGKELMMKKELFAKYFKNDMLSLADDKVSNVRLALAKVLRHHFLGEIHGPFVFDIEVNDTVRVLKKDKRMDVKRFIEDIQTFPLNDDREVTMEGLMARLRGTSTEENTIEEKNQQEETSRASEVTMASSLNVDPEESKQTE